MYRTVSRYKGDPHWVKVKYPCVCNRCGNEIVRGSEAFYYPRERKFYCSRGCGQLAERDFNTMAEAEDYYGGKMRMIQKARGMMGYDDYSPQVLSEVKFAPCASCRKKTPHRKFAGKYYCDYCGEMYSQPRKVKRSRVVKRVRKTASRKKIRRGSR